MFKSIKECMKNWILSHERAYWYLVFGIAIGLFALITGIGLGKLETANAAEVEPMAVIDGVSIPDIRNADWSKYAEHFETEYGYTGNIGEKIIREHKYCVVVINPYYWPDSTPFFSYLFTNEPVQYVQNSNYLLLADWNTSVSIEVRNGVVNLIRGYGNNNWDGTYLGYGTDLIPFVVSSGNMSSQVIASTYDFRNGQLSYHNSYQQISYPEKVLDLEYGNDAPYVKFETLNVVNRIVDGTAESKLFHDVYNDWTKTSYWEYVGFLQNMNHAEDLEYFLEVDFVVELPTDTYINDMAVDAGINLQKEKQMIMHTPSMVSVWNADKRASKNVYKFTYGFSIEPELDGYFKYRLSFDEIELLLQYFNEDARSRFQTYDAEDDDYWKCILLSYVHVESVSMVVKTTRVDSIVYGKGVINIFERGVEDVCVEIAPDIDYENATEEEIDKIVQDAVDEAYDKYMKDLENRVNELEGQIDGMTSVELGFGDLEGSDLWSGFGSVSKGLSSLGPSVKEISSLSGSVLSFLPGDFSVIIYFTLFAICVIALIHAIRG